MKYNYHTHTYRCNHATGTSEEYILEAIKNGFDIIGISEHNPHLEKPYNMGLTEFKDYVAELLELKEKYKDQIKVLIGLECEYLQGQEGLYLSYFKDKVDYLILGNHFSNNYNYWQSSDESRFEDYLENLEAAFKTGFFSILAHPDLILFKETNYSEYHKTVLKRIIEIASKYDVVLEINCEARRDHSYIDSLGEVNGRYTTNLFLDILSNSNAKVVVGSDCHRVECLDDDEFKRMHQKAKDLGIKVVDYVNIKNPLK